MKVKRKNDPAKRGWVIRQIIEAMSATMKILAKEFGLLLDKRDDHFNAKINELVEHANETVHEVDAHSATINMLKANVALLGRAINHHAEILGASNPDTSVAIFRLRDSDGEIDPADVNVEKLIAQSKHGHEGADISQGLRDLISTIFGGDGSLTDAYAQLPEEALCPVGECDGCDGERVRRIEAENAASDEQAAEDTTEPVQQDTPAPDVQDVIAPFEEKKPRRRRVVKKSGDTKA